MVFTNLFSLWYPLFCFYFQCNLFLLFTVYSLPQRTTPTTSRAPWREAQVRVVEALNTTVPVLQFGTIMKHVIVGPDSVMLWFQKLEWVARTPDEKTAKEFLPDAKGGTCLKEKRSCILWNTSHKTEHHILQ